MAIVRSGARQRWSRSHLRRYVFQSGGRLDLRRLLIGTRAVTEYKLTNIHKTADVAIRLDKRRRPWKVMVSGWFYGEMAQPTRKMKRSVVIALR
jgi:hypothetical protein